MPSDIPITKCDQKVEKNHQKRNRDQLKSNLKQFELTVAILHYPL